VASAPDAAPAVGGGASAARGAWSEPWRDVVLNPGRWQPALLDLCSERRIDVRVRDVSLVAVEAAVAGAAVAAGIAAIVLRKP